MEILRSVCPYDCPDCCGLLVEVEDGLARKVKGDPAHSFTRGTLCPKMAHYERTVHSPRRLLTPLKRTGKKGAGEFRPISWRDAVQEIAARWQEIIARYGAEAIQPYSYAGTMGLLQHDAYHALFRALGAAELDRTICSPAKRHGWNSVMGATLAIRPQEAQQSDLIILWSLSMLATDIHFAHDVQVAKKRGARIWCVDTYETATARQADRAFFVRPGTDGALALALLHVLEKEGLTDETFLAAHVQGWQELKKDVLPHHTPESAAAVTGLSPEAIRELALAYGKARAPFIRLGSGFSRYTNGAMTTRLLLALPAAVGAWKKPGGGLLSSVPGSRAFSKDIVQRPDLRKNVRLVNMCEIGNALTSASEPPIKSLFVYSSNPACTAPDQKKVTEGLLRDDLFTVVHERFLTDTALYADIVLPATTSLEHSDIYAAYGHYTIQRGEAVIPAVGESKPNWAVACLLADALGLDDPFFKKSEDELIDELIASTDAWPLPVDKAALATGLPVDLPLPENYKLDFKTPSGKIELMNPKEEPPLPDYFPAHGDAEPFQFISAPDARILDSSFNEREELSRGKVMELLMHPNDAEKLGLADGDPVVCSNERGAAGFTLALSRRVRPGTLVSEGVWWRAYCKERSGLNMLTSQRLTDKGGGSTFYDVNVRIERES